MTDDNGPTDWSKTNHALQKQSREAALPLNPNQPLSLPTNVAGKGVTAGETAPDEITNPKGILAKFQVGAVNRKAAVDLARVWREKQLEAVTHRLTEVVRFRNAEASAITEQLLASINTQHLEFLMALGLRNEGQRRTALGELTEQTAGFLRDAQGRDWPEPLRDQFIAGVMQRHNAFFEKLVKELGE